MRRGDLMVAWLLVGCGAKTSVPDDAGDPPEDDAAAEAAKDSGADAALPCRTLFDARNTPAIPIDIQVAQLALADLDRDLDLDLVAAGMVGKGGAVGLYANDGRASFAELDRLDVATPIWAIVTPDLDGDGDPDVVASTCFESSYLLVALQEAGAFVGTEEIGFGETGCLPIVAGDVDGDGAADVIAPHRRGLAVFPGLGDGRLGSPWVVQTEWARSLSAGDLDGDGRSEIVAVHEYQDVRAWAHDGAKGLEPRLLRDAGDAHSVVITDVDGDEDLDVAVWGPAPPVIYRNDGGGDLGRGEDVPGVPDEVSLLGLADMDGRGDIDWLIPWGSGIAIVAGAGGDAGLRFAHGSGGPLASGDLDGDGDQDLAAADTEDLQVEILLGEAWRFPHEGVPLASSPDGKVNPESLAIADLDGDGAPEVAVTRVAGLALLRLERGRLSLRSYLGPLGERVESVLTLDLDLDGDRDLVCVAEDPDRAGSTFHAFSNDGTGGFDPLQTEVVGRPFEAAASGDLDGDGDLDVAAAANDGTVTIAWNVGGSALDLSDPLPVGAGAEAIVVADLDGDSEADIATANDIDDTLSLLWGPRFGEPDVVQIPAQPEAMAAGDMDGDGDLDLVVVHGEDEDPTKGPDLTIDLVTVLHNDGQGGFGVAMTFDAPGEPRVWPWGMPTVTVTSMWRSPLARSSCFPTTGMEAWARQPRSTWAGGRSRLRSLTSTRTARPISSSPASTRGTSRSSWGAIREDAVPTSASALPAGSLSRARYGVDRTDRDNPVYGSQGRTSFQPDPQLPDHHVAGGKLFAMLEDGQHLANLDGHTIEVAAAVRDRDGREWCGTLSASVDVRCYFGQGGQDCDDGDPATADTCEGDENGYGRCAHARR
ncbi:MAG: VCBS repeat-containing protein [Deltaproteobacteria bacterium]|nr:VCBS repeat-containing protein [Deltaproteobacteria bacterium]